MELMIVDWYTHAKEMMSVGHLCSRLGLNTSKIGWDYRSHRLISITAIKYLVRYCRLAFSAKGWGHEIQSLSRFGLITTNKS